jgi:signal transduction histidine kinase
LLTPLTRARTRLSRIVQPQLPEPEQEELGLVIDEIDDVLGRFRAILRMSQLDSRDRRAGFSSIDLNDVLTSVADLYQPVAEDAGIRLMTVYADVTPVLADPKLMVEAVSNLVDNAIKFANPGGQVQIKLDCEATTPRIIVQDDGPGIGVADRAAVLQRFRRAERNSLVPGFGIGLSVVAAITRLHGFELRLEDAAPGLRVVLECRRATH